MKYIIDILTWLGLVILAFIVFILFIVFGVFPFSNNCYKGNKIYEYEDIDGNKGNAHDCQYSDAKDHYKKGGQGHPICFVGKKVVTVKWYEDKTKYMNCFKSLGE